VKPCRKRQGFTPSKRSAGAPPVWSAGESFAVCGRRLKELFEKSSLRIFKNFLAVLKNQKYFAFRVTFLPKSDTYRVRGQFTFGKE
jgi:hypothetical protein